MLRWLLGIFDSMRADDEDAARALRIQREYMVPPSAVLPEPTGKRIRPRTEPEMTSRYDRVVNR